VRRNDTEVGALRRDMWIILAMEAAVLGGLALLRLGPTLGLG
jgi:hypothetical protein